MLELSEVWKCVMLKKLLLLMLQLLENGTQMELFLDLEKEYKDIKLENSDITISIQYLLEHAKVKIT
jgi:hypothetical protein